MNFFYKNLITAFIFCAVFVLPFSVSATSLIDEDFDSYSVGSLGSPWVNVTAPIPSVVSTPYASTPNALYLSSDQHEYIAIGSEITSGYLQYKFYINAVSVLYYPTVRIEPSSNYSLPVFNSGFSYDIEHNSSAVWEIFSGSSVVYDDISTGAWHTITYQFRCIDNNMTYEIDLDSSGFSSTLDQSLDCTTASGNIDLLYMRNNTHISENIGYFIDDIILSTNNPLNRDSGFVEILDPTVDLEIDIGTDLEISVNYWNYGDSSAPYNKVIYNISNSSETVYFDLGFKSAEVDNVIEEKNMTFWVDPSSQNGDYILEVGLYNSITFARSPTVKQTFSYVPFDYYDDSLGFQWYIWDYPGDLPLNYPKDLLYFPGSDYTVRILLNRGDITSPLIPVYNFKQCITIDCSSYVQTFTKDVEYSYSTFEYSNQDYIDVFFEPVVNSESVFYELEFLVDGEVKSNYIWSVTGDSASEVIGSTVVPEFQDICGHAYLIASLCKLVVPSSTGLRSIFFNFKSIISGEFAFIDQVSNAFRNGSVELTQSSVVKPTLSASGTWQGASVQLWDMSIIEPYMPTFRDYFSLVIWLSLIYYLMRKSNILFHKEDEKTL